MYANALTRCVANPTLTIPIPNKAIKWQNNGAGLHENADMLKPVTADRHGAIMSLIESVRGNRLVQPARGGAPNILPVRTALEFIKRLKPQKGSNP